METCRLTNRPGGTVAWLAASLARPCPCCRGTDACSAMADRAFVRCRTVVSAWPVEGGGWLHARRPDPGHGGQS